MMFGDLKTHSLEEYLDATRDPDALCLFIHIPKTAGSSLGNEIAAARRPYRNIHIDYHNPDIPYDAQMQAAVDRFISDAGRKRFRSASGHITWRHARQIVDQVLDTRVVTFLRNPVARVISDYRYQTTPAHPPHLEFIAQHPTIDSYLEKPGATNKMSRHIIGRGVFTAEEVLETLYSRFTFAGVVEMYPMCFNLLFELFGVSNRMPSMRVRTTEDNPFNQVEVTPELTARIEAINDVDMIVYNDVRETLLARQEEWKLRRNIPAAAS